MVAGRHRWLEHMREAKGLGIIDRIPTGRRLPRVRAAPNKAIARARGITQRMIDVAPRLDERSPFPYPDLASRWNELVGLALQHFRRVLEFDPGDDVRLARMQREAATFVMRLGLR